jgi:hypothetical protein
VKIALVGSAPTSIGLAPFDDPEWTIWGCSPGGRHYLRRLDAWFEVHRWSDADPEYNEWLRGLKCPVYLTDRRDDVPASLAYPQDEILAKYPGLARSFFTSSLAWMLALAIEQKADEIGLWGVDMAASEEYAHQKPGCHFFMLEAERRGIKLTVPPESDLLRPVAMYGFDASAKKVKFAARRQELEQRLAEVEQRCAVLDREFNNATRDKFFILGALDDMRYHEQTWRDE